MAQQSTEAGRAFAVYYCLAFSVETGGAGLAKRAGELLSFAVFEGSPSL